MITKHNCSFKTFLIMNNHRVQIVFAFLLMIQFSFTIEATCRCNNNCLDQSDHVLYTRDYGASGIAGPVNLTLSPTLQPGAVISVVTRTSVRGQTNLFDNDNEYILHVDARIGWGGRNELLLTTYMNSAWRQDYRQLNNPIASGAKVTTTLIYEPNGYRIFINGKEIAFYDHRLFKKPTHLNLVHDTIYKVMYLTTIKI